MKLGLVLLSTALALHAADSWTPALSMKVQAVADVIPSPDGKLAVWTQTRAVMEDEKSEYLTHVFLGKTDGTWRRQLTRGEKSANAPAFSPNGEFLFFLSDRAGKRNLYRIPISGGEAEQLTNWKGTIASYAISPDGKQVAFVGAEEDKDDEKRKKSKNDFKVIDADPKNQTLYSMPLDGEMPGKPKRLIGSDKHTVSIHWSPDSKHIAVERRPTPSANDARLADIVEVNAATGSQSILAATAATEAEPRYSPDGRYLLFLHAPGGVDAGRRMALLSRADNTIRELPPTFDEQPSVIGWSPDSKRIFYAESKGTRATIHAIPVDGPPVPVLAPDQGTIGLAVRMNASGTHIGFVKQNTDAPVEAWVAPCAANSVGAPVRVSAVNVNLTKAPLGKTDVIRWKSKDGLEVEGLLTYPVDYQPGKRVPLILVVHGGPSGVYGETFIGAPTQYPIASFAAKGYAVLRSNPRGSSGYGKKFRQMVIKDWGGLDFQDLMSGVDQAIKMNIADPAKLAVMGWSYGGYMTAWTVTQTNRFKAAAVGAGITNTVSMYGTQDIPRVFEDYFGSKPWEDPATYSKSSPMQFVKNVKTPTLILHGENDPRVPPGQAQEFYRALKDLGVDTKLVLYPRMPHGPNEPKFTLNIMEQHLEWVSKRLE